MKTLLGTVFCMLLVVNVVAKSVDTDNLIDQITLGDDMKCSSPNTKNCNPGEFVAVVDNCQYFCHCREDRTFSDPIKCYLGRHYDSVSQKCMDNSDVCQNTPTNPIVGTACHGSSVQPFKGDCYYYLACSNSKWTLNKCGEMKSFDISTNSCKFNFKIKMDWYIIPEFQYACNI